AGSANERAAATAVEDLRRLAMDLHEVDRHRRAGNPAQPSGADAARQASPGRRAAPVDVRARTVSLVLVQNEKERDEAIKELRAVFPTVPARGPEGAQDENSTYLHLLDCYLEYRAVQQLLGELKTRQVMEFWATDHYTWVYRTVLERPGDIAAIMTKHKLLAPLDRR